MVNRFLDAPHLRFGMFDYDIHGDPFPLTGPKAIYFFGNNAVEQLLGCLAGVA